MIDGACVALRQVSSQLGAARAGELLDDAPVLAAALGFGTAPADSSGMDVDHRQQFVGDALRLLGALAAEAPTVLLVKGLHWADRRCLGAILARPRAGLYSGV